MWNKEVAKKKNNNNNNNKKALVVKDMAVICLLDNAHLCSFGKRGKPFLSPFFLFYFSPTL